MKIVTSGLKFLDIDAYAGCVAYAELLRLNGEDAVAFSSATMNESIAKTIRSWDVAFSNDYEKNDDDTFVLIDVSEPDYLEKIVDIDKVEQVIDHHIGFEQFWRDRIGDRANLEFIGAACTQVYEQWVVAGRLSDMSEVSARLLIAGILDNTLHFKASVTTDRDVVAFNELQKIANLPDDWPAHYFSECQQSILEDIEDALKNDTKIMQFRNIDVDNLTIGQLVIWDAEQVVGEYRSDVERAMNAMSDIWFVNIVSIDEGKSYFISSNGMVEEWATKVLGAQFNSGLAKADRLWLRKEIFKQDQSRSI